jgi:hypothetical protein
LIRQNTRDDIIYNWYIRFEVVFGFRCVINTF